MADKTRESNLWASMKYGCRHLVKMGRLLINRVENKASLSMPDLEGMVWGPGFVQFWIELKTTHRPKRTTTPIRVKFQIGQPQWLERRWNFGGNAWVLIQVGKAHQRSLYLVPGCYAPLVDEGVTEDRLLELSIFIDDRPSFEDIVIEASRER